ncbi:MAG: helix-turn-helix transcriptional regulator, partial [Clostridia bacterium]|nr:helix-turn-helix transcriptional regulator [Clostridia bacterium]
HKITVSDVAKFLNLERSYFYRIFKEETGISPSQYLIQLRMSKSKALLEMGESVKTASSAVGIDDIYHFSKTFSKKMGITPSLFKKQQKKTSDKTKK